MPPAEDLAKPGPGAPGRAVVRAGMVPGGERLAGDGVGQGPDLVQRGVSLCFCQGAGGVLADKFRG